LVASALIPVSLIVSTQGDAFFWGKLMPSLLAAIAATAAGVVQFERPHERWRTYRGYQRALEAERFKYENRVEPYEIDDPGCTRRFAIAIVNLQRALHLEWSGLLPPSSDLAAHVSPQRRHGSNSIVTTGRSPRSESMPASTG
jgi:hypothetical protein